MKNSKFVLILAGIAEITPKIANMLFEAIDGEIELNMFEGVAYLEVERHAPTLRSAIISTIKEIGKANCGVRVVRVESEAANTIAKINADLLGTIAGKG